MTKDIEQLKSLLFQLRNTRKANFVVRAIEDDGFFEPYTHFKNDSNKAFQTGVQVGSTRLVEEIINLLRLEDEYVDYISDLDSLECKEYYIEDEISDDEHEKIILEKIVR